MYLQRGVFFKGFFDFDRTVLHIDFQKILGASGLPLVPQAQLLRVRKKIASY